MEQIADVVSEEQSEDSILIIDVITFEVTQPI